MLVANQETRRQLTTFGEKDLCSSVAPLASHNWLRSGCFDETYEFYRAQKGIALAPQESRSSRNRFWFEINLVPLARTDLCFVHSRTRILQTRMQDFEFDYLVQVPLKGWIEVRIDDQLLRCEPGGAVITSPNDLRGLTTSEDCRRLVLKIKSRALLNHLIALLGELPKDGFKFIQNSDSCQVNSRRLADAVRYAVLELEHMDSMQGQDAVIAELEDYLLTLLLMSQPNNCQHLLGTTSSEVRPRDVKRAMEFIDAHLDSPISIPDLVAASGVPGRTLHQHFRDFTGKSPMGYVRDTRLERIHVDLLKLGGEQTVTEVAGRWGFNHMGRFSAEYTRRFGELPSITARRRKYSAK